MAWLKNNFLLFDDILHLMFLSFNTKWQIYLFTSLLIGTVNAQEVGSGYTIDFDGESNRIFYDPLFNSNTLPITVSYWLKIEDRTKINRVFNSCWTSDLVYQGFSSHYIADGVNISYGDAGGGLNPAFRRTKRQFFTTSEEWFNITVVVRSALDMNIYLNGIDIGGEYSGSGSSMDTAPGCQTLIGYGRNNAGSQFLEGQLDELRVWDFALTEAEVRNDMVRQLAGNETDLIGYWRFDEGTGNIVEEEISNETGVLEGDANWVTSGAPLGDESFHEYFDAGTKRRLFKNGLDSFWISTEADNWVGYQVYKVNDEPNSTTGSMFDFSGGYYGIFPVFENGAQEDYIIEVTRNCTSIEFRNGNDDLDWEIANNESDSTFYFSARGIAELNFSIAEEPGPIASAYTICQGEELEIDAESPCIDSYVWSTGDTDPTITVTESGNYWVERTNSSDSYRDNIEVTVVKVEESAPISSVYNLCPGYPFEVNAEGPCVNSYLWSTGDTGPTLTISEPGEYWLERITTNGSFTDSFVVTPITSDLDLLSEEEINVCPSDLPFTLRSSVSNNVLWSTGESNSVISIDSPGLYWVEYEDSCQVVKDSVNIIFRELDNPFIPNVLTPNNDGKNDCFVVDQQVYGSELRIFNRAGAPVYQSNSYINDWCPKVPSGVYYYSIFDKCSQASLKGWFTVLR